MASPSQASFYNTEEKVPCYRCGGLWVTGYSDALSLFSDYRRSGEPIRQGAVLGLPQLFLWPPWTLLHQSWRDFVKVIIFVGSKHKMSQIPLLTVALWDQRHLIFFFNENIVFHKLMFSLRDRSAFSLFIICSRT